MKRLMYFFIIVSLFSCSKNENGNFIFERTWKDGQATDIIISSDTMYVVAGEAEGSPFIIKVNRSGSRIFEYLPGVNGAFNSLLEDTSGYYAAGHSNGDILVSRINHQGEEEWSALLNVPIDVSKAVIRPEGEDSFLVCGSAHIDSSGASVFSLFSVDRTGTVSGEELADPGYNVTVNDFVINSSGNIYAALAKSADGSKSRASVAEMTKSGDILWENELYNNSKFAAACQVIKIYDNGDIFVAGKTELNIDDNTLENSFLATLDPGGDVKMKKYLESSNIGVDISFDDFDRAHMLNRNCFIINIINNISAQVEEMDETLIRTFAVCDPYATDSYGSAIKITAGDNYLLCGSQSGKVYYALRKGDTGSGDLIGDTVE
ncbi:MAG: hypothetical protein U5K32_02725 [Bacteroidales bacterium]|nr:hypothetical protein [Bacteroidales bacterium]